MDKLFSKKKSTKDAPDIGHYELLHLSFSSYTEWDWKMVYQSKLQGKTSQQNGKAVQSTSLTNAKSIIKDLYTNLRKKELGPCPCHILHPGPRNTLNMLNYTLHIRKEIILENYRISIQP
ncbi:hypothetical protein JHK82_043494 [Glycine max]|uniref:Uncharacterized protein n=2 Tax=Glycine subgen. Soja TaxID=1462606 RepID=K7MD87_SOYBN|nr:hypothetical protein JHK87_043276 [Glycine soja]KAG4950141.1 hypothetical protein JHK86_043380 [Glycine max]KAG4957630.1 hypothetical protein JHK85_044010 [Glycine max]KAG5106524.1 hypothetical protein JHK82_043494 [Glycine max]KAG5117451.1 hypothetical protein JHK84_043564 [Glycine max]